MSTNTSLPGGGGSAAGPISPVGITGLVGITGPLFLTGPISATMLNFPLGFGASISNFPALFGITGMIGVSVSNTNFGVTGALGVSIINTGVGVTFPVISVTFPIGFGVTFPTAGVTFPTAGVTFQATGLGVTFPTGIGITFVQLGTKGITGNVGLTGSVGITGVILASLGFTLGKTSIFKFGSASLAGTTPGQAFCTYIVTGTKSFFLEAYSIEARFTSLDILASAGSTFLGAGGLQSPVGTTLTLHHFISTNGPIDRAVMSFAEPIPFGPSAIINLVATPPGISAVTWIGNIIGYER